MLCRSSRSIRWNQRSGNTSVPASRETNESVRLGTLLEWRLLSLGFHSAVVAASDVTITVAMPMIGLPWPSSTILSELLVDLVLCPLPVTGYLAGSGLPDEGFPGIRYCALSPVVAGAWLTCRFRRLDGRYALLLQPREQLVTSLEVAQTPTPTCPSITMLAGRKGEQGLATHLSIVLVVRVFSLVTHGSEEVNEHAHEISHKATLAVTVHCRRFCAVDSRKVYESMG